MGYLTWLYRKRQLADGDGYAQAELSPRNLQEPRHGFPLYPPGGQFRRRRNRPRSLFDAYSLSSKTEENMQTTKLDSKRRLTLRGSDFDYYHVREMDDGTIFLEPRELTVPFRISANTLAMMDESVNNMKAGKVSAPIDLSEFED